MLLASWLAAPLVAGASAPTITDVTASQRTGTKLVDIAYTISDTNATSVNVFVIVSSDSGATWTVPASTFTGAYGTNVSVTSTPAAKAIVWSAGADWNGQYTTRCRVRVLANDAGMVLIPAGTFQRGDNLDSESDAPVVTCTLSTAYYMDATPVTGALWRLVYDYSVTHGYDFENSGSLKSASHPVQSINWWDAVKWCNARSEMEGAAPVYYSDPGFTSVAQVGEFNPYVKPGANGYRLPTEAEFERAARGGSTGHRFPLADADTISQSRANYDSSMSSAYDLGPLGYNPIGNDGTQPYTTPVGTFAPNAYFLYDMAGNVREWGWDWYGNTYYASGQVDPQGPASGTYKMARGGSWNQVANSARCAAREVQAPISHPSDLGFRCVRAIY
jgi:formylglycine-generating enzyme required for sulfatase activity